MTNKMKSKKEARIGRGKSKTPPPRDQTRSYRTQDEIVQRNDDKELKGRKKV